MDDEASQTYVVPNKHTLADIPEELRCEETIGDTSVSDQYILTVAPSFYY